MNNSDKVISAVKTENHVFTFEFTSVRTYREKSTVEIEAASIEEAKKIASNYEYEDLDWAYDNSDEPLEESLTWVAYDNSNQKGGRA